MSPALHSNGNNNCKQCVAFNWTPPPFLAETAVAIAIVVAIVFLALLPIEHYFSFISNSKIESQHNLDNEILNFSQKRVVFFTVRILKTTLRPTINK
jgi:hypothetical protein